MKTWKLWPDVQFTASDSSPKDSKNYTRMPGMLRGALDKTVDNFTANMC